MTYETDEEKVETIKKWWKENGLSVIAGTLIGLGGIFGWRLWIDHRDSVAGKASATFEKMLVNAAMSQPEAVAKQAERLKTDYAATPYASLGAMVAAKTLYQEGNATAAISALQDAIANAPDPALARIAALRLARIQIAEGQLDAATATITAHDDSPDFAGEFAAIRGDLAIAHGDMATARSAYEQAIEKGTGLSQLIRLKLDNLPAGKIERAAKS